LSITKIIDSISTAARGLSIKILAIC